MIRHSEKYRNAYYYHSNDSLQVQNEKIVLTLNGELSAKKISELDEFKNLDSIYSSNYTRSIATAKYLADANNVKVQVVDDFGERKIGIDFQEDYPKDFEIKQFENQDYKLGNGESFKETKERMYRALMQTVNENRGKNIAIVSHATAMMCLFSNWCNIIYQGNYTFNGKVFFDGNWNILEPFKLIFNDDNLESIEHLSIDYLF